MSFVTNVPGNLPGGVAVNLSTFSGGVIAPQALAVSTDGTFGLPLPTGIGPEEVWATVGGVPEIIDMRFNGLSG